MSIFLAKRKISYPGKFCLSCTLCPWICPTISSTQSQCAPHSWTRTVETKIILQNETLWSSLGMKALVHFLNSDAIPLVLTVVYAIITIFLAVIFKSDTFDLLAYRSFNVNDKSLSYTHVKSVISGNLNIALTTIYSVSINRILTLLHPLLCLLLLVDIRPSWY